MEIAKVDLTKNLNFFLYTTGSLLRVITNDQPSSILFL